LEQNANLLNIQADEELVPQNQMSLNVVENTSAQSLGVYNTDIHRSRFVAGGGRF
jgi:hypothetical protein